ncbi:MAG TPA: HAD-IA family hydrolase [Puia sp.]|nr:HAD-IA family hydrolase [Puia sp.]
MSAIQLVVFDIAGTTVRDRGDVADAFIRAFGEYGLEIPADEVRKVMGFRKSDAISLLLEKFPAGSPGSIPGSLPLAARSPALAAGIHGAFISNMISFYEKDPQLEPLPHAEEIFTRLKERGLKIALNTGFTRAIADTILRRLHWNNGYDRIDRVICSDEVPQGRPSPDMINTLIAGLGISSSAQVMKIGDTEVDVEEGRNAGCRIVVSVTTGANTRGQLEQYHPDHIIDDLRELIPIISNA